MKITITGPRSVGKSTISKIVAKKLNLKYYSSDEIGEKYLKKEGGLDKAIKSGAIGKMIKESSYSLIREVYEKKDFVFDLSGGAFGSRKYSEASKKVRELAKKSSIIIGLLPSKNVKESVEMLFEREKERKHFKEMNKEELLAKVQDDYMKFPQLFKEFCSFIIYVKDKTSEDVADEIASKIRESASR
ncbi:MAG: shikimate kinase I [Candidatus Diapherotrites archaeon ADurb.Bin253]|jgi:shikimate kinase|nr:MAG: shikimate kinase I [Candidatus Diapherotrites archaeon ADurb.Bin253]HNZ52324.1 shikimate kinase [Candidatus Pacearchaeota archaeon]HOH04400.1 shikimate kinase [Candidatus Pacearchaeota archaeon]